MFIEQREMSTSNTNKYILTSFYWSFVVPVADVIDDEAWNESMAPTNNLPI